MKLKALACVLSISFMAACGGSGSGGSSGTQYTVDVQGSLSIAPAGAAQTVGKETDQQIMIGTMLLEVTNNAAEELGVDLSNLDLQPETQGNVNFQFILVPTVTSDGIIFKICPLGNPFGTSYLDLNLAVKPLTPDVTLQATGDNVLMDDGETLVIGGLLRAEAEASDRSRIPVLSDIPVINFLFQGEQHDARMDNLLILLTPQILSDTET